MRSTAIIMSACLLALAVGSVVLFAAFRGDAEGDDGAGTQELLAAGDIAECDHQGDEATARILSEYPNAKIATLGDNAYQHGTLEEFQKCYAPSWGQFKDRTRPATGNHDEATKNAQGYWDFFGARGGPYDRYYYSYDLGPWHVVVLNSDCWRVDGCEPDDPQAQWLRRDLEQHPNLCTLAYWHRPPFSSGRYGDPKETERVRPLWRVLYEEGADVLLTGHEHSYERFAPMNAGGERDDAGGVRLFVVGTGGGNLRDFENDPLPTTDVRQDHTWGVLKLTLNPTSYDWKFLPVAGKTFADSGSGPCH
jgi:calcineurin-like phosphoesterase family protein